MKVTLANFTPNALSLLLATKNTRLGHDDDPNTWSDEKRAEHLAMMRDTIKSSWEFVDYTFRIEGVTRAFTHQLVRTRTGSYAQESMRVTDVRDHEVDEPLSIASDLFHHANWVSAVDCAKEVYSGLIDGGVPAQDARGILPTNMTTSIWAKFTLRALHDMALVRLCTRTQGEYQDVFRAMRAAVIEVHPWTEDFIEVHCVANGTCAFPRYGKDGCPVYLPAMDNSHVRAAARELFNNVRHVATPVVRDGKTVG